MNPRIIIELEGGLIKSVMSDHPLQYLVVDRDVDTYDNIEDEPEEFAIHNDKQIWVGCPDDTEVDLMKVEWFNWLAVNRSWVHVPIQDTRDGYEAFVRRIDKDNDIWQWKLSSPDDPCYLSDTFILHKQEVDQGYIDKVKLGIERGIDPGEHSWYAELACAMFAVENILIKIMDGIHNPQKKSELEEIDQSILRYTNIIQRLFARKNEIENRS